MSNKAAVANAVGGRTARACDGCAKKRARWYCAADDAFLCQSCDASVHSANPVARRHERLRLKTSANSILKLEEAAATPPWLQGFKRKPRTPRGKPATAGKAGETLVPDLEGSGDETTNGEEEQLLYRVPIFDPALAEFCSPPPLDEGELKSAAAVAGGGGQLHGSAMAAEIDSLVAFLPSDVDLAEFAADMESLLGRGLEDDDAFCMEGLGLAESRDDDAGGYGHGCCVMESDSNNKQVKMEVEDGGAAEVEVEISRETIEINFDCGSPAMEAERKVEMEVEPAAETGAVYGEDAGKSLALRLDYKAVITAWSSSCHGASPWTDGERPQLNPDDCWPDYTGMWGGAEVHGGVGGYGVVHGGAAMDGGREARVTRYREKRRTRLFSKKIRYEVRKLNAEKRPRMKGRFVKRSSFPAASVAGGPAGFPY